MLEGSAFLASSPAYHPHKAFFVAFYAKSSQATPTPLHYNTPSSASSSLSLRNLLLSFLCHFHSDFITLCLTYNTPFSSLIIIFFLLAKLSKGHNNNKLHSPIMGKDWYWSGRSSSKRSGGGAASDEAETQTQTQTQTTPSGCMCAVFHIFDFHPFHFPTTINHHQQQQNNNTFNNNSPSSIPEDITTIPKGAEAPRNSLKSEDGTASSVLTKEEEDPFKIPKNIQIKTSGRSTRTSSAGNSNEFSSSDSPAKTPTLVARLMGLDLLPAGSNSPSSSSSSCLSTPNPQGNIVPNLHHHMMMRPKQHHIQTKHRNSTDGAEIGATRSLPETPRISSSRRSDVDYHHRLSLQINKENNIGGDDLEMMLPRFSFSKRKCDENNNNNVSCRNSSHLARQIVKQVKESAVSRKVGQDITNNLKLRDQAREEPLSQFKTKKSSKSSLDESSPGKHHSNSSSPRLRFMETNRHNKSNTITTPSPPLTPKEQNTQQPQLPRVLTRPTKPQALMMPEKQELQNQKSMSVPKCNKATNEKFSSRFKRSPLASDIIIKNKQEEPFVVRSTSPTRAISDIKNAAKSKRTHPLSSNLHNNINTIPNLFPIKTDPSPPATKINQNQVVVSQTQESKGSLQQLPSWSSHMYKQERMTNTLASREQSTNNEDKANDDAASTTGGAEHHRPEFQYITGFPSRTTNKEATTNTTTSTTVSLSQRFSPTNIFDHLEEHHHHPISNSHVSSPNNNKVCNFSMKNQLGQRWNNRRLMSDLVDEVLTEILRPRNSEKNKLWFLHGRNDNNNCQVGSVEGLMERVRNRIGKFPCKKCEFLEDIDGLIESEDMEKVKVESEEGLEEEGEVLVGEIEGNIWDTLVHETVMVVK